MGRKVTSIINGPPVQADGQLLIFPGDNSAMKSGILLYKSQGWYSSSSDYESLKDSTHKKTNEDI